jgi:hypothetical protein
VSSGLGIYVSALQMKKDVTKQIQLQHLRTMGRPHARLDGWFAEALPIP